MLGWAIAIGAFVLGVLTRNAIGDTRYMIAKEEFEQTTVEQGQEIARLRAQVALHIGKEKQ